MSKKNIFGYVVQAALIGLVVGMFYGEIGTTTCNGTKIDWWFIINGVSFLFIPFMAGLLVNKKEDK